MASLEQFAGQCRSFATVLPRSLRVGTETAAREVKELILVEFRTAGAHDLRLRGVGKRGARIGARYTMLTSSDPPTAIVQAFGPVQLLEYSTRPHVIPKTRSRGRKRVVVIPNVGVRAFAHHPGTRGKRPFAKAKVKAEIAVPKAYGRGVHSAIVQTFKG